MYAKKHKKLDSTTKQSIVIRMEEQNNALPQVPSTAGSPPQPTTDAKTESPAVSSAGADSSNLEPSTSVSGVDGTPAASPAATVVDPPPASAPEVTPTAPTEAATPDPVAVVQPAASSETPAAATPVAPASEPLSTTSSMPTEQPLTSPVNSNDTVVPAPINDVPTVPAEPASTDVAVSEPVVVGHNEHTAQPGAHHSHLSFHSPKFSRKSVGVLLILLVLLASLGSTIYFALGQRSAKKEVASLQSELSRINADTHDLPEGAVKLSECVPNMGFHYIEQGADPKFGPLLLVSTKGKVIGYEYMFNNSMLTKIPDAEIPLEVLLTNGPVLLNDWQYNSIDFSRATAGHPGFEDDHYDVHLYTVNPEEQKRACE